MQIESHYRDHQLNSKCNNTKNTNKYNKTDFLACFFRILENG